MTGVVQLTREERYAAAKAKLDQLDGGASPELKALLGDVLDLSVGVTPYAVQPPIGANALTPLWMQNEVYPAQLDRGLITVLFPTGGVPDAGSFLVSQRAAGTNMSVDVAAGNAVVVGSDAAGQGNYLIGSTAVVNRTLTAAPSTGFQRIDRVVLHNYDQAILGAPAANKPPWDIEIIAGTPVASGPVAPAAPTSSLTLATIGPILSTTAVITNALITDARPRVGVPTGTKYRCSVYRAAGGALTTTLASILWDTVAYDPNGNYNSGTGVYTAPAPGFYLVMGHLKVQPVASNQRLYMGCQYGSPANFVFGNDIYTASTIVAAVMSIVVYVNAGDPIAVQGAMSGGITNLQIDSGGSSNYMRIHFLSPA